MVRIQSLAFLILEKAKKDKKRSGNDHFEEKRHNENGDCKRRWRNLGFQIPPVIVDSLNKWMIINLI